MAEKLAVTLSEQGRTDPRPDRPFVLGCTNQWEELLHHWLGQGGSLGQ